MIPQLQAEIEEALKTAKGAVETPQMRQVILKLEEALLWFQASQKAYGQG